MRGGEAEVIGRFEGRAAEASHQAAFFDSENERSFAQGTFDDYRRISAGDAAWLDIADFHQLHYIVARYNEERGLESLVSKSPRCRVIYRDQMGVIAEVLAPKAK